MQDIKKELAKCPFCGACAKVEDHGSFKIVGCSKLSMLCPNPRMAVYNNDFSHWNTRASDDTITEQEKVISELEYHLRAVLSEPAATEYEISIERFNLRSLIKSRRVLAIEYIEELDKHKQKKAIVVNENTKRLPNTRKRTNHTNSR